MARTENPEVRSVLWGHVSEDTAYLIKDYPYGGVRTQKKIWVETARKGKGKGQQRICEQTLNPKNGKWNEVHHSTYCHRIYLYLDQRGHVQPFHMSLYGMDDEWCRLHYTGMFDQLPQSEQDYWRSFETYLEIEMPDSWARFRALQHAIEKYLSTYAVNPLMMNEESDCYAAVCNEIGHVYEPTFKHVFQLVKYMRTKSPSACVQ